jgi:hypothetical protein
VRGAALAGRLMTGLAVLFMTVDGLGKVLKVAPVVEGTVGLGYPETALVGIGLAELLCVAVFVFPPTSVLGAVLLTGYLGGAVATHVRIGSPVLTHVLFPTYVAAMIWGGLYLREARLRTLVPLRH